MQGMQLKDAGMARAKCRSLPTRIDSAGFVGLPAGCLFVLRCVGHAIARSCSTTAVPGSYGNIGLLYVAALRSPAQSTALALVIATCSMTQVLAQSCSITNTTGNFGSVDILSGSAATTSAPFNISCSGQALSTVRLCIEFGPGHSFDGSGNRLMVSGANSIRYDLYTSAAYATIWGSWGRVITQYTPNPNGVQLDLGLNGSGNATTTLSAYGRIYGSQQTAAPGTYTWTSASSPGIAYGYNSGTSCPTGSFNANTSGTTWTATIAANCTVTATSLAFGSASLIASNIDSTSSVSVTCTNGTPYKIALNFGTGVGSGPVNNRRMTGPGGAYVKYSIFKDAARSSEWGDSLGISTNDGTGIGSTQNYTAYARVFSQTTPASGTYSDTIVVTVDY